MAETWMARVERRLKALEEWQEDQRQHNEAAEAENAVRDHALAEMASRVDSLSSRVDGCALRSELATATAERASLSSRVDGLAATAAELRAAIETLRLDVVGAENQCTAVNTWRIQFDARLAAIEAKLVPAPPPDPPGPVDPPPVIEVDEGPIVIEGSGRVEINLADREVWPGFRTKDNGYQVAELVFRGPGVIRPRPGFAAIRAVNMAGGATVRVLGAESGPVELYARGDDVGAIDAPAIALLNLEDVLAMADQRATKDRHARPAVVWCPQTKVSALWSVVCGGNSAIYSPLEDAEAEECLLMPRQFAVNGYAWSGGHFINSIALPMAGGLGGRGVLLERIKGYVTRAVILAYDVGELSDATPAEPNKLYDRWGLDGCGVRVRYGASLEMGETVVCPLAGGILNHGTALMLSHATHLDIWRNELTAINVAPGSHAGDATRRDEAPAHPRHFRARPISFESIGTADAPAELSIRANTFAGNQYLVSTTGTDTADPTNARGLVGNLWCWREGVIALDLFFALLDERAQRIARPWWQRCGVNRQIEAAKEAARALLGDAPLWPLRATWSTGVGGARECLELEENVAGGKAVIWQSGEPGFCSPGGVNPDRALIVDGVRQPPGACSMEHPGMKHRSGE